MYNLLARRGPLHWLQAEKIQFLVMTVIFSAELLSTETRSSKDECSTGSNNHPRLEVVLDHRSPFFNLSNSLEVVWMFPESYSSSSCLPIFLTFFCLFVFLSKLIFKSSYLLILVHWSRVDSFLLEHFIYEDMHTLSTYVNIH